MQFLAHPRQQVMVLVLAVVVAIAAAYFMAQHTNASNSGTTADPGVVAAPAGTTADAGATTSATSATDATETTPAAGAGTSGAAKQQGSGSLKGAVVAAKANESKKTVSEAADTIESCAATLGSGEFVDAKTTCWDATTIRTNDPTLAAALAGGGLVTSGTKDSYKIVFTAKGVPTFTLVKAASGTVKKTCAPKVKGVCTGTW